MIFSLSTLLTFIQIQCGQYTRIIGRLNFVNRNSFGPIKNIIYAFYFVLAREEIIFGS